MAIIFFGVVTPTTLIVKFLGKDLLRLKKNKANSYWINKDKNNHNMTKQF